MRIWAALLVLAALVSIGAPAFAQAPPPGAPGRAQAPAAKRDEAPPEEDAKDAKDAAGPDKKGFSNSRLAALFSDGSDRMLRFFAKPVRKERLKALVQRSG